jgi:sugar transferase (PEP-CTERM system associated)
VGAEGSLRRYKKADREREAMYKSFSYGIRSATLFEFLADILVCFLATVVAASEWMPGPRGGAPREFLSITESSVLIAAAQFALVMSLLYWFVGMYRRSAITVSPATLIGRAFLAVFMGACIAVLALSLAGEERFAMRVVGPVMVYIVIGAVAVRALAIGLRRAAASSRRVLIVGTGPEAQDVASDIRAEGGAQAVIVGYYAPGSDGGLEFEELATPGYFTSDRSIEEIAREHRVSEIVVAVREQRGGGVPMDELLACRLKGIEVLDLAGFYERSHCQVPIESLKGSWLVYGRGFVQGWARAATKRAFDILISSVLILLTLPIMLCAIVAIWLESPGPIIYRQERVGLAGRLFMCLKFRSMRVDAESDGVARWATQNDSRITQVGLVLRKTRIDELPQLFSVLRGDMSLVGPRPERQSFVGQLRQQIPFYDIRHSVKPGVTGWAQVRYRYGASVDDARKKHRYDLYYVKNNSLFLDILVLFETVSVVLFREGSQ